MTRMDALHGFADPQFSRVRAAFASCFADDLETGAAVSVVVDGALVVDLWGGHMDAAQTKPWTRDTVVNVWSVTKGITALAIAMAVDQGLLEYDQPLARYWPEFGARGKGGVTLGQALSHQAGLNGLSTAMDLPGVYDGDAYAQTLADMAPLWEPGSRMVYHAFSFGTLVAEPLRRVDGRSIGRFVREDIAAVLEVAFFIGLPADQDHRAAEVVLGPGHSDWVAEVLASPYPQSCDNPMILADTPNDRRWRAAEIAGANGQSDALALATIYGGLATGASPLISRSGLAAAVAPRFEGVDAIYQSPTRYAAGFKLQDQAYGARASRNSFGHCGWGGSMAFADPEAKVGFGFVTNRMQGFSDGIDPRHTRLTDAVYAALG